MEDSIKVFINKQIQTEFTQLKVEQDVKWKKFTEDILKELEPPFSLSQAMNWLFGFIGVLVVVISFVLLMRFDIDRVRDDFNTHERVKEEEAKEFKVQIEKILTLSTETNNTVIELKTINNLQQDKKSQMKRTEEFFQK